MTRGWTGALLAPAAAGAFVGWMRTALFWIAAGLVACGTHEREGGTPYVEGEASSPDSSPPAMEVDTAWPPSLGDTLVLGEITGIAVDQRDHVWILIPPDALTEEEAAREPPVRRLPPVVELDSEGRLVQGWEEVGGGYEWPRTPHGIFVDHRDRVWVGFRDTHLVLKYDRRGELLLTLGRHGETRGSNDSDHLGGPADIWVDPETDEVFVADGYGNRRIVVYDAEFGNYLRHWGAYGERPDDEAAESDPRSQFSTAHGIVGSRDGLIYVADRGNNRIQVFQRSGTFVQERFVAQETEGSGSAFDLALSPDPDQRFVYLVDGSNDAIWVLRRDDLSILGRFGETGPAPGAFRRPHNMDVDGEGHLYLGEVGNRGIQRILVRDEPGSH